jgi:hypothetical protein
MVKEGNVGSYRAYIQQVVQFFKLPMAQDMAPDRYGNL